MSAREGRADNRGLKIHYLDSAPDAKGDGTPIVFVPGALGAAEDYRREFEALAPRRCIALSLRGRGKSDAPEMGYSFADHVGDIEALIEHLDLRDFCLMGFSMAVPLVIEYTARYPERLSGLLLGDYPAHLPSIPPDWVKRVRETMPERATEEVVRAIQAESKAVDLWDRLARIECPTLVLRGGQEGAMLSVEDSKKYLEGLGNALVAVFEESGHLLWEPSIERYLGTLRAFLMQLDALR